MEEILKDLGGERHLKALKACENAVPEEDFFQTKTYSLAEVKKDPEAWRPAILSEYETLKESMVLKEIIKETTSALWKEAVDKGIRVERIPSMGVYTRKAGAGKRKARIIGCGNYMESRRAEDVYASGLDSAQLRAVLRKASLCSWTVASVDIRSAFLNASSSQTQLVIVDPPRLLFEMNILPPGTLWYVTGVLYGLSTAPKDWSNSRDSELPKLTWKVVENGETFDMKFKRLADANLWSICAVSADGGEQMRGILAVYVDDMLIVTEDKLVKSVADAIQSRWTTSPLEVASKEHAMRFCGLEIRDLGDGQGLHLSQESYIHEVLARYNLEQTSLCIRQPEEPGEEKPELPLVRRAQKITGELLWLSGRSRPDIAVAVSRMSQQALRNPTWTYNLGLEVLRYLGSTKDVGLFYGPLQLDNDDPDARRKVPRRTGTVEVMTDASFAPNDAHSVSGCAICYGGAPIHWSTAKQSLMSLSTAEAELTVMVDGLQAGRSVRSLVALLENSTQLEMLADNRAALVLAAGHGGGWRTRHLRIRSNALTEAIETGEVDLSHRAGRLLLADGLTKLLNKLLLEKFRLGMGLVPSVMPEVQHVEMKSLCLRVGESCKEGIRKVVAGIGLIFTFASLFEAAKAEDPDQFIEDYVAKHLPEGEAYGGREEWSVLLLVCGVLVIWEVMRSASKQMLCQMFGTEEMKVKLLSATATVPLKGSDEAAGFDLATAESFYLGAGERMLVSTGLALELPKGTYGRLASRSGLASNYGIEVGAGVIDTDFRGEIRILLFNRGDRGMRFNMGDKVAQLVVERIADVKVKVTESLSLTQRGTSGFGSTGGFSSSSIRGGGIGEASSGIRLRALRLNDPVEHEQEADVGVGPEQLAEHGHSVEGEHCSVGGGSQPSSVLGSLGEGANAASLGSLGSQQRTSTEELKDAMASEKSESVGEKVEKAEETGAISAEAKQPEVVVAKAVDAGAGQKAENEREVDPKAADAISAGVEKTKERKTGTEDAEAEAVENLISEAAKSAALEAKGAKEDVSEAKAAVSVDSKEETEVGRAEAVFPEVAGGNGSSSAAMPLEKSPLACEKCQAVLKDFYTDRDGWTCSRCEKTLEKGRRLMSCRGCDFDLCAVCAEVEDVKLEEDTKEDSQLESKARRNKKKKGPPGGWYSGPAEGGLHPKDFFKNPPIVNPEGEESTGLVLRSASECRGDRPVVFEGDQLREPHGDEIRRLKAEDISEAQAKRLKRDEDIEMEAKETGATSSTDPPKKMTHKYEGRSGYEKISESIFAKDTSSLREGRAPRDDLKRRTTQEISPGREGDPGFPVATAEGEASSTPLRLVEAADVSRGDRPGERPEKVSDLSQTDRRCLVCKEVLVRRSNKPEGFRYNWCNVLVKDGITYYCAKHKKGEICRWCAAGKTAPPRNEEDDQERFAFAAAQKGAEAEKAKKKDEAPAEKTTSAPAGERRIEAKAMPTSPPEGRELRPGERRIAPKAMPRDSPVIHPDVSQGELPAEIPEDVFGGLDGVWIGEEGKEMFELFDSVQRVFEKEILPVEVKRHVVYKPEGDEVDSVLSILSRDGRRSGLFFHRVAREKLFDMEADPDWPWERRRLTLAWFEDGMFCMVIDDMVTYPNCRLKYPWTGITVLYKVKKRN